LEPKAKYRIVKRDRQASAGSQDAAGLWPGARAGTLAPVPLDWDAIDAEFARLVDIEGLELDRARIERFARDIAAGRLGPASNAFARVELAQPGQIEHQADWSEAQRRRYLERGHEALARGRVAVAVLNGGMATRFGGEVKGIVEAVGGRTFLEIKLHQARRQGEVPFLVMNSFATHARTRAFLEAHPLAEGVELFLQDVSVRLTPRGELFRGADGALSLYAPGHGDFPAALRRAGLTESLGKRGVQLLQLSNIDNLGAELDPLLIGYHLEHGRLLSAELADTLPGDVGGAPAVADGRLQIVEGFRFPAGFDFARLPCMATNTFLISLELLEWEREFTWFYVEKSVDGRVAVQMERLINELSAWTDTAYLVTPRGGAQGRFFPIKTREDLLRLRADPELVARFSA
jgi:UTP--glucose-1-phosphate uridylyltransferase